MEPDEYRRIALAQDEHWWYRNTRAVCAELLSPWLRTGQRLLDAGCGPGGNGAWMAQHGSVVGLDRVAAALTLAAAHRPELRTVLGDLTELPFPDSTFDVVLDVTVTYAVPDHERAIGELARVTRPGGAVLVFEPAFAALRRAHDTTVHGVRRYRRRELVTLLERSGLHDQRSTYVYSFLAPAAAGLALADRVHPPRDPGRTSDVERSALDRVFGPLSVLERRWLRTHRIPFGTSVAVVATRPDGPGR